MPLVLPASALSCVARDAAYLRVKRRCLLLLCRLSLNQMRLLGLQCLHRGIKICLITDQRLGIGFDPA